MTRPAIPHHNYWTPEALALLAPLRREIEQCQHAYAKGTISRRYEGVHVSMPGGGRGRRPLTVNVLEAFDIYVKELERIREELQAALRENNHQRFVRIKDQPPPEWIDIIVANERRDGHPAGTLHWTQWARPGLKKQITRIFALARAQAPTRGRSWIPYPVPQPATKGTP